MNKEFWFAFDADRIQQTIFESNSLPVVRGASSCLREILSEVGVRKALNTLFPSHASSIEIIFADGGSGLLRFPSTFPINPGDVGDQFERWFSDQTKFASVTTAFLETSSAWQNPRSATTSPKHTSVPRLLAPPVDSFARQFLALSLQLQARKRQKGPSSRIDLPGWASLCSSCGVRPACLLVGGAQHRMCPICANRYDLNKVYSGSEEAEGWYQTTDQLADRQGAIALLYLDGNGVGRIRDECCRSGVQELRAFSTNLAKTIRAGLEAAGSSGVTDKSKLVALSLGGDDIAILVQGDKALRALFAFEQAAKRSSGAERLTFSAGIVVAPFRTPIPLLHRLAHELCGSAKQLAQERSEWACDLSILTGGAPLAGDAASIRQELTLERGPETLRLSSGPWTLSEMHELADHVQQLDAFHVSASSMRQLVDACRSMGRDESTLYARSQWARDKHLRAWVAASYPDFSNWPWRHVRTPSPHFVTRLVDIEQWRRRLDTNVNGIMSRDTVC